MDENNNSSEALEGLNNLKPEEEEYEEEEEEIYEEEEEEGEDDDDDGEEEEEEFDDEKQQRQINEIESSTTPITTTESTDSHVTQSETLVFPENDLRSDLIASSHLLSEVPVEYTLQPHDSAEFKRQTRVCQQQALASVATRTDHEHLLNHLQLPGCQNSSLELSPTSVTQSILSVPSPTLQEQKVSPLGNNNGICVAEVNQKNSSYSKTVSTAPSVKAFSVDGYNWRKYGQKQVKSPQGFRSYYKCTYSQCYAKKIECSDNSSSVIEVIYKSGHSHDPPQKINCTRERRLALSVVPVVGSNNTSHPVRTLSNTEPATSSGETIQGKILVPETKQQNLSGSDGIAQVNVMEEHIDKHELKRRVKKNSTSYPGPNVKPCKKPKFVVHAAGDVGISGDGYRWRKYGQKMVKGTPHPRNYYRCTSAGCPVRKYIEMTNDNKSSVVMTYKGIHDHDMPVPKKRHGPPSVPLLAAAAPVSIYNLQNKKPEELQNDVSATQWSVDKKGELTGKTLDLGAEKAMESARTLLSIGFEIKPC